LNFWKGLVAIKRNLRRLTNRDMLDCETVEAAVSSTTLKKDAAKLTDTDLWDAASTL